jgi:hypothetical protein
MTIKTIKNVDDSTWYRFKKLAVRQRLGMGALLQKMVNEYESKSQAFWKDIFEGERILTDAEADRILKEVAMSRKDRGFRE